MTWWVYMIQADDDSLYTGVTTDVCRRFAEHSAKGKPGSRQGTGQGVNRGASKANSPKGKGARYFAGRTPVAIVYTERLSGRGDAQRREAAIKKLSRADKLALLQHYIEFR